MYGIVVWDSRVGMILCTDTIPTYSLSVSHARSVVTVVVTVVVMVVVMVAIYIGIGALCSCLYYSGMAVLRCSVVGGTDEKNDRRRRMTDRQIR